MNRPSLLLCAIACFPCLALGQGGDQGVPSLSFLAVGDTGTGTEVQSAVARAMGEHASTHSVDFAVLLGDNFYPTGVTSVDDEQWTSKFEAMYVGGLLKTPFYPVLGNHDHLGNPLTQVEYRSPSGRWNLPSAYHSFERRLEDGTTIEFFLLDTTPIAYSKFGTPELSAQLSWLDKALKASRARWKVAVGHHPIRSGGLHGDEPGLINRVEPLFKRHGLDLYFAGHDHDMQVIPTEAGYTQIVSGTGAKLRPTKMRENAVFAESTSGFAAVRITRNNARMEFLGTDGTSLFTHTLQPRR